MDMESAEDLVHFRIAWLIKMYLMVFTFRLLPLGASQIADQPTTEKTDFSFAAPAQVI
jgi:hypothetical protein